MRATTFLTSAGAGSDGSVLATCTSGNSDAGICGESGSAAVTINGSSGAVAASGSSGAAMAAAAIAISGSAAGVTSMLVMVALPIAAGWCVGAFGVCSEQRCAPMLDRYGGGGLDDRRTEAGKPGTIPDGENDRSAQRRLFRRLPSAHDPSSPKAPPEPCLRRDQSFPINMHTQRRKLQVMTFSGKCCLNAMPKNSGFSPFHAPS